MKKIAIIFLLIFIKNQIFSETYVSGLIDKVENWDLKFSPYIINETVIIGKKGILTIYPGTEIKFKKGAKLLVSGILYAKGNKDNPVRFLPYDYESFYEGIYFDGGGKSIIEYIVMIRGAITVEATRVEINNNYILNSTGIILKNFADVILKNNLFLNNTYGVHMEGSNINHSIYENTFAGCRYGIYILKYIDGNGTIKRNNFLENINNITNYSIININCTDNYWGTDEQQKIVKTIVDKKINPKVGEIIYKPYLKEKLKLPLPPASFISLVKTYLNKKKPREDIYRFSLSGGFFGFFPIIPERLNNENNFGLGYSLTFTFNPFGPIMLGVETNFFNMDNMDKSVYSYNMNISEFLLNIYGYFGYDRNIYLVPYAKFGNGISLVNESYISNKIIFNGKNTLKYNEICYSISGGLGLEWFLMKFFSFKLEGIYHYFFYPRGNISLPVINISGNVYFDTPFFLNR
ncbi:MAG: hypothetical protein N2114_07045 [Candidatus Goldbacteria bacterium]|nr:hypothetical protein [Candidatus Goldiibacteriota bacterium]